MMNEPSDYTYLILNLESVIKKANILYRIGDTFNISDFPKNIQVLLGKTIGTLSDNEYDFLLEKLKELNPESKLFNSGIIESHKDFDIVSTKKTTTRKQKLAHPMYSLNKETSITDLKKWFRNKNIPTNTLVVLTPKYDGVSVLRNEKTTKSFSRGDGIEGQEITEHYKKLNPISQQKFTARKINTFKNIEFHSIGELIIPREVFKKNKEFFIRDNGETYKNPRNMVAGLVNNDDVSPYWKYVEHVRYGIADDEYKYDKSEQLDLIYQETGFKTTNEIYIFSELTEEKLDELYYKWGKKFEIDGIVIDINDKNIRKQLGRETNNNPAYARAYKVLSYEEHKKTIITNIEWNISKQQYLKPVAIIKPVELGGVTISRVTLNNAKYVVENKLGIDSEILITRSGQVIPKIIKVIKSTGFIMPIIKDSEIIWNDSNVELMLKNSNDEVLIKKITSFFEILNADNISEGTIKQFYNNGFTTIEKILNLSIDDLKKLDRFGERKSNIIYNSIKNSITNVELSKLQHASNLFKNLGSKKLKLLEHFKEKPSYNDIISIVGFSHISAQSYLNSYDKFYEFIKNLPITIKDITPTNDTTLIDNKFNYMSVVFTGVRRKDLSDIIESQGGKVLSGISKNVTHLVCKDINSNSSKMQKARKLGIKILSVDDLEKMLN